MQALINNILAALNNLEELNEALYFFWVDYLEAADGVPATLPASWNEETLTAIEYDVMQQSLA